MTIRIIAETPPVIYLRQLLPRQFRLDGFVISLACVVLSATVMPCQGNNAKLCHALGMFAISSLFFLQGARLSREAILKGINHWKLHAAIASTTFILFPLIGLGLSTGVPQVLPPQLWLGVLFLCALPSTVQSSIALTSIAEGNVPGALCSATASNLAGMVLTPLLIAAMSSTHGARVDQTGAVQIVVQMLVPFIAGHLARPWIGQWAQRNRSLLAITDRGSILLVVYTAFSAAVVRGIWYHVPSITLAVLFLIVGVILAAVLAATMISARALGFARPDEVALVFCGSQKSLVSGVPIANVLFSAGAIGPMLLPIMIYYPVQLLVCAWLARWYASRAVAFPATPASSMVHR